MSRSQRLSGEKALAVPTLPFLLLSNIFLPRFWLIISYVKNYIKLWVITHINSQPTQLCAHCENIFNGQ